MGRNKTLQYVPELWQELELTWTSRPIADDGDANVECFNVHLKELDGTDDDKWFTASWLFAECYL